MGELLLGGGVGRDGRGRLNAGLWRPGGGGAMTGRIGRLPVDPDLRALYWKPHSQRLLIPSRQAVTGFLPLRPLGLWSFLLAASHWSSQRLGR